MVKVIKTVQDMQKEADRIRQSGKTIGFVPTMGYLHEGHLSLIRLARQRADVVVVSIYVNPTQFGPNEDLDQYPRDFRHDEALLEQEKVDIVFYPSDKEMYPEGDAGFVEVKGLTESLCGASRPGHFRGVTTICTKLFHAVKPHFAVFGQKDAQQAAVIKRLVKDLHFDLDVVVGPIVREADGLAMSSRNTYLSSDERRDALSLDQVLKMAEEMVNEGERNPAVLYKAMHKLIAAKPHLKIDYISIVDPDTLEDLDVVENRALIALAVFAGKTRLIDNVIVEV